MARIVLRRACWAKAVSLSKVIDLRSADRFGNDADRLAKGLQQTNLFSFVIRQMRIASHGNTPCNFECAGCAKVACAVTDGRPSLPWAFKPVPQLGSPSAVPSRSNGRLRAHY